MKNHLGKVFSWLENLAINMRLREVYNGMLVCYAKMSDIQTKVFFLQWQFAWDD